MEFLNNAWLGNTNMMLSLKANIRFFNRLEFLFFIVWFLLSLLLFKVRSLFLVSQRQMRIRSKKQELKKLVCSSELRDTFYHPGSGIINELPPYL